MNSVAQKDDSMQVVPYTNMYWTDRYLCVDVEQIILVHGWVSGTPLKGLAC